MSACHRHRLKMAFTLLLIAGLQVLNAEATRPCVSPLYAEYGQIAATFACSLPSSYYGIYWYKSPARNERSVVSIIDGVVLSGDDKFGISPSGSLIVRNITFEDEHLYRLIILRTRQQSETHDLRLTVYAYPGNPVPLIDVCGGQDFCFAERDRISTLSCKIEGARPPVSLRWERQADGSDPELVDSLPTTSFTDPLYSIFSHTNGSLVNGTRRLDLLTCVSSIHVPSSEHHQSSVLLENVRDSQCYQLTEDYERRHYLIGSDVALDCSQDSPQFVVWKKRTYGRKFEPIAFRAGGDLEEVGEGFEISSNGSLIIKSYGVTHEGEYICIDASLSSEGCQLHSTRALVLPPAHQVPTIAECEKKMDCILTRPSSGVLSCYVEGVRPVLLLEWEQVNSTKPSITFSHHQYTTDNRGEVSDVRLTASYELTGGPDAGPIIVACVIKGPVMTGQQTTATIVNNSPAHAELSSDMSCNNTPASSTVAWAIAAVTSATSLILSLILVGLLIAVRNGGMFRKLDGRPTPI